MIILSLFFYSCKSRKVYTEIAQTNIVDPEIIIANIGDNSREQIAKLITNIGKCNPLVVGVDIVFPVEKSQFEDALLTDSFKGLKHDVIAFRIDTLGKAESSIEKIRKYAKVEGHIKVERDGNIVRYVTPIYEIDGKQFTSFALEIVKLWKPEFRHIFSNNKSIPILYQRGLNQFKTFALEDFESDSVRALIKDKIVLVGFLGPGGEDLHLTPVQTGVNNSEKGSYMYVILIQANIIRTLLTYDKQN